MRSSLLAASFALAVSGADHGGTVTFGELPLPGATVTISRGNDSRTTITNTQGAFLFRDVADGTWKIRVEMQLFETQEREVVVVPASLSAWEMKTGTLTPATASSKAAFHRTEVSATPVRQEQNKDELNQRESAAAGLAQRAADGLLINGSINNGASSPFALLPAFGNNRRGQRSMYNGSLGFILNNSSFDARNYSLTGQNTPKPGYNRFQGLLAFGGPLKIPKVIDRGGPVLTFNYQWTRNSNASTQTGLFPTAAERAGQLSRPANDPASGAPFPEGRIPASRISSQARALLGLYPLPNFDGSTRYDFQVPIVNGLHEDNLQVRGNKQVRRNYFSGSFAWQSIRNDTTDLFGFLETGGARGFSASTAYRRGLTPRSFLNFGLQYSSFATRVVPYFSRRRNVSGEAGVTGNDQDAVNWGPPALLFSSGISTLAMSQFARDRNQTTGVSADGFFVRGRHNATYGASHNQQQFNVFSQQDPRGTFAFTGALTGNDFAGFLLGVPDTASIAFGNADKYLRAAIDEVFANDDWRVNPSLTINVGVRWEYWAPVQEKYGRLVNLDIGPGFRTAEPSSTVPCGDWNNISPRIGLSWRPFPASSMVVRAGYGIYFDTSVYQPIAVRMSQQAPLSRSLRIANSPSTPLSLAAGFPAATGTFATTFGVDPAFRTGYSQNWQFSIQRDLPAALQFTATYNGSKGTRSQQQFLPNTFPGGAIPPSGFLYLASNGNANRHAGQAQVRRRLRSGLTASIAYTYAKAIDNSALGGRGQSAALIAQDWTNLSAERGRSSFDQRHAVSAMGAYTTGIGLGTLFREWTFGAQSNLGTGLPLTPIFFRPVSGTGFTGTLRPDYTGADVYAAPAGFFLNPAAYAAPAAGRWGNAGRNTITGPKQFVVNASMARTFRSNEKISYDFRLEAANVLNSVTYPSWNTVSGHAQFGLPNSVNPMRTVQAIFRARF